MSDLLTGRIAATINRAMGRHFLDATLARNALAAGQADELDPTVTTTVYSCKATHESYGASFLRDGLVHTDDVRVLILAKSIKDSDGDDVSSSVRPLPGDRITIRSRTFAIVPADGGGQPAVDSDPALAVWDCRCRG